MRYCNGMNGFGINYCFFVFKCSLYCSIFFCFAVYFFVLQCYQLSSKLLRAITVPLNSISPGIVHTPLQHWIPLDVVTHEYVRSWNIKHVSLCREVLKHIRACFRRNDLSTLCLQVTTEFKDCLYVHRIEHGISRFKTHVVTTSSAPFFPHLVTIHSVKTV